MPPDALTQDAWTPESWTDVVQPLELSRPDWVLSLGTPPRDHRWLRSTLRFVLLVVMPTLLTGAYLTQYAADRFVSEAKFLVRKPNALPAGQAQSLSVEQGPKGIGTDDAYAVRDFMLSRDAMTLLLDKAGFRDAIQRASSDPLWRFPGTLTGSTDEDLYQLYLRLVSADYDSGTGVTTLRVEAFRPDDAQLIAFVLMDGAENLLNRLNKRARSDAVDLATKEVARARAEAVKAEDRLTAFRERQSVIDPTKYAETVLATIVTLSGELVESEAQLDVTLQSSPKSPQVAPLRGRIRALQNQIDHERSMLGGSDLALAGKIENYERLVLTRDFAQGGYISALNLQEAARLDMLRQQEYLEHIVEPGQADKAHYPLRVTWTTAVFALGLAVFLLFRPARRGAAGRMG